MVLTGRVEKVDRGGCNITRDVRLPVGSNGKASHVAANGGVSFETKVVEWHSERAYTVAGDRVRPRSRLHRGALAARE